MSLSLSMITATGQSDARGVTLIEVILYILLSATILFAITGLLVTATRLQKKSALMADVHSEGAAALEIVLRSVRKAQAISAPAAGASGSTLALTMSDAAKNPTVFSVAGNILKITEGASAPLALSSSHLTVANFSAQNRAANSAPGSVHVEFTITSTDAAGRAEYSYTETLAGGASVRLPP